MGRSSQRHKMEVHGYNAAGDTLPSIASQISDQSDASGGPIGPLDVTGDFSDATGALVKYEARGIPDGLVFVDGVFTGTPSTPGTYITSVFAVTDFGMSKPNSFTWTIT